jgi:2'-5' RNA ligase
VTATAWDALAAMAAAAQPDYSGSCMIALYPPPEVAERLAIPDGLSADEIHLTVAYTGDCADVDEFTLAAAANALAARRPVAATISGHARFTGGDAGDVIVALVDSPMLDALRRCAVDALATRGIAIPSEHGFTAHCSLAYIEADAPDPVGRLAAFPVTFTGVTAEYGTTRYTFPFSAGEAQAALPADPWEVLAREAS